MSRDTEHLRREIGKLIADLEQLDPTKLNPTMRRLLDDLRAAVAYYDAAEKEQP